MKALALFIACIHLFGFSMKAAAPLETEDYAELCGLSETEFVLFSSVVEAESNRQAPEEGELTTQGRIYIALTIWNRVYSERWPSNPTAVLTQRNQFSTVRNGASVTNRTDWSDRAVYEAYVWINEEDSDAPNVQFFNCRWFFSGLTAYPNPDGGNTIGGNYFSLGY